MSLVKDSENLDLPSAYLKSFLCSLNLVFKFLLVLPIYNLLTEVTSSPSRPVDNVITKGLQDRNMHIIDGTTVENKGNLILTEIFPSVQKHDI